MRNKYASSIHTKKIDFILDFNWKEKKIDWNRIKEDL